MSTSELACTYASLLLHADEQPVTAEKINTVLKAAGVTVEPFWPALFAKSLQTQSLDSLICNIGAGVDRLCCCALRSVAAGLKVLPLAMRKGLGGGCVFSFFRRAAATPVALTRADLRL